ncbi:MAG TPA: hypothetical protein VLR29_11535 [Flavobacterium sp.]|nr:hypothetical protein [Flavobacterium sp.]
MEEYSEIEAIEEFELQLNESAKGFLKEATKWAYFLSILGYIGIGFIVLAAVFAGAFFAFIGNLSREMNHFGAMGGSFVSALYLMIAAFYFFPVYYLNKFASNAKLALRNNDSRSLAASFEYLKSHYKFMGIVALVILSLYSLIMVFVVVAAVATSLR